MECCSCSEVAFVMQSRHPGSSYAGTPQTKNTYHNRIARCGAFLNAARSMPHVWRAAKAASMCMDFAWFCAQPESVSVHC